MELKNVSGLKELADRMRALPDRVGKNVLRGSVNAGASVIKREAVIRAPEYTGKVADGHPPPGTLKRSIYQKWIRELSGQYKQTFFVGVRHGKREALKKINRDAFYWRWVEFGSSKMAARPYMRPAFDTQKFAAIDAIKGYLEKRIPEEVAKLK